MYILYKKALLIFVAFITLTGYTNATEYPAHTHGMAQLTMVIEHNQVALELVAPSESIVGFEHQARTKDEKRKIALAKQDLLNAKNVLYFNGGHCQLKDNDVEINHEHLVHSHHAKNPSPHKNFIINYKFFCRNTNKINSVVMTIFKSYRGLKKITSMWVNANNQGTEILNATSNRIYLK